MNTKKEKGFTIIEVVLVLAIAGLIFMMVFIALPALQRSQRDTQRKNDLSRLVTALNSYQSNNRGSLPTNWDETETTSWKGFLARYVRVSGDTFKDPSGGGENDGDYELKQGKGAVPSDFVADNPYIYVTIGSICNGESLTEGQGSRKVAFQMKLEGSGIACVNN